MQIIPIQAVPNQSVTVTLEQQLTQIDLYQTIGGLFINIYLSNSLLVSGIICQNLNPIIRNSYFGYSGDFAFIDTQGDTDPVYTGLGSRYVLAYLTAEEMAASS